MTFAAPDWRALGTVLRAILAGVVLAVLLFPVLGWIGSSIPRNSVPDPVTGGVEIMVETNGVHTGIVMPVVTPEWDWRAVFPSAAEPRPDGQIPTHVAVGWGEREIFLHVARWGDLGIGTALRIATLGGEPVMRVSHYVRPRPSEDYRPVTIAREDYARMAAAITQSLAPPGSDGHLRRFRGSYSDDAYYAALGHYTLAGNCNDWVGDRLADGGLRMGWWTPFAGGVMKWIEPPPDSDR